MEIRPSLPADAKEIETAENIIFSDPWCEADITHTISTEGAMCYTALEDGKVIAAGTHSELLASCPAYRSTVELQKLEEEKGA